MTIQTRDATGAPQNVGSNTTINLTSTSANGRFDTSPTGPFNGSITSITIPAGSSSASFYYKDTSVGTPTITAAESPSQGWTDATQTETVTAAPIAQLVFTTPPQTIPAGVASAIMTIQTRDAANNPSNVASNTTINLTSTSGNGRFDTSPTGPFNGSITSITIPAGSSSASFYYKDTNVGAPTITAAESPARAGRTPPRRRPLPP